MSVPRQYEYDGSFGDTSVRIDALADPAQFFDRRACPSGRVELAFRSRFARYATFDPDLQFVYVAPDTTEPGDYDIVVDGDQHSSALLSQMGGGQGGVVAAVVIIIFLLVGGAAVALFVFRRALLTRIRGGAE